MPWMMILLGSGIHVEGDGFVFNEGVDVIFTGSQFNVGSSPNTFAYESP